MPYIVCLFMNILKPIYATLSEKGHLNVGYIEDLYLQGGMIRKCQSNVADTCCSLTRLGFLVQPVKSVLVLAETVLLGFYSDFCQYNCVSLHRKCVWHQRAVPWAY